MTFQEKSAWLLAIVTAVTYAIYVTLLLERRGDSLLSDVSYIGPMLITVGIAIVANIVLSILAAITSPENADLTDERDEAITRHGERSGSFFVAGAAVAAMAMAMLEWHPFWIANVIYLGFVLSTIRESVTRILAYRRGLQPW